MLESNLLNPPKESAFAKFPAHFGTRFLVTIDTEEEFDWNTPFRSDGYSLSTIPALRQFQQFCESFGIIPCYMMDWPIATAPAIHEALGDAIECGKAEIGAQLHPWVTPPFTETVNVPNSYAGNLPRALERAKLSNLCKELTRTFNKSPRIYRAGRYGLGPNTTQILQECGIAIDSSVRPYFDYSHTAGPNYRQHPCEPYWANADKTLLELPLTSIFDGFLHRKGPSLYPYLSKHPTLAGAFARTRLLERIPLTPEGTSVEESIRAIDRAIEQSLPILVFSFHSPSLGIGHTPYVRSQDDLNALYNWWAQIFIHLNRRNVEPTSIEDISALLNLY